MKQTTIKFSSKNPEPVTIKRLQEAIDLIAKTKKATDSLLHLGLSTNFVGYFRMTNVIQKIAWNEYIVTEPILSRKSYNRVMSLQTKYHNKQNLQYKSVTGYNQLPKANTNMLGLVNLPKVEVKRISKPRAKKAVALPWWKRFLLYLANH
jgi:hypothetical protein